MKKIATKSGRKIFSLILAVMLILGVSSNVFAGWEAYNNGIPSSGVYLQETWIGEKQSINFWENGQWIRNVAGESHTLWINSQPILYDLYDTRHWCYDQYGNCFAINTNQRLLFCGRGSTTFSINNDITGCTGFQRDGNKIGYWVNTYNGSYSLSDLLNGGNSTINNTSYNDLIMEYPCVKNQDNMFYYYTSSNQYYTYCLYDSNLVYKGSNTSNSNILISNDVDDINFTNGYIVYALNSGYVYKMKIGSTYKSSVQEVGRNYYYFREVYPYWSYCYYNINCNEITYETENDDNYNYGDNNTYEFPYVRKSGDCNYYFYTDNSRYYQYYLKDSVLYYEGTNNSKSHTKISNSVDKIVFSKDGYIIYSDYSGNVYSYSLGKTSSSYRKKIGTRFSYFDQYNYISGGYYNTNGRYIDFNDYNDDNYNYDYYDYPYVEKSGDYYYYHTSKSKYYKYYFDGSTLYYKGTNNSSNNTKISTSVCEITFSKDGYIIYSNNNGYVYAYSLGKTSSSYKVKVGRQFSYFNQYNYMSDGYYDEYDDYIEFDF